MEDEARKRRERLEAIRQGKPIEQVHPEVVDVIENLAAIKPTEKEENEQELSNLGISIFAGDKTLEAEAKALLEETKNWKDPAESSGGITLEALAPKRVNWDLKQSYEGRTEPLRKQYDRACIELIHERIEQQSKAEDTQG